MDGRRLRAAGAVCAAAAMVATASTALGAAAEPSPRAAAATATPTPATTVVVRPGQPGPAVSPLLTGVNNDQWFERSHGLWDGDRPDPDVVAKTQEAGIAVVRYPGGTPATFFDWTRAIGPAEQRSCQTDGRPGNGAPRDSDYGPDEHMRFVTAAGAEASIMTPFARSTPERAAGWVEYMNGAATTTWGARRAANGHATPYGVRYWEVGNEHDRPEQRYWMSDDPATALRQYAFGGTERQQGEQLGKGCDFRAAVASDGTAGQVFGVRYPPVAPDTQTVRVGGEAWTEVADLAAAGPADRVYTVDDVTGAVSFGDGVHGAVPPRGAKVTADYDSGPHAGFVDYYAAMKAADPSIDVCATWAPITADTGLGTAPGFPEVMAQAGHGDDYDCLVVHPYTNFRRSFGSAVETARELHDWHLLGEAEAVRVLRHHADAVATHGRSDAYVTTSEFGALFFGANDTRAYPSWNTAMSHAVYMASQWARLADLGVPWAEGNTLVSEEPAGLRAVLGGEPEFVVTSDAVVRRALRPVLDAGGHVVAHEVRGNPVVPAVETSLGSAYDALVTTATKGDDGGLRVVVVNRDPERDVTARVVPSGYRHDGTATVATVLGANDDPGRESFESHNSIAHPGEVTLAERTETIGRSFALTFPKHSVTVVTLRPALPAGDDGPAFANPVQGAETGFADPTVIRGRDGWWYAYGTGRGIPMSRSADLVTWEPLGVAIPPERMPSWVAAGSGTWAPDIAFAGGRYVLTFTVTNAPGRPSPNRAVGLATAPTPSGPWTPAESLLLEPEYWHPTPNAPRDFRSIMDSDLFVAQGGTPYLYYGGFRGGIHVVELTPDALAVAGERVKIAAEHAYEGAHVVEHDGWYHLMVSSGGCCAGAVSGYQVLTARSRDPLGPFLDRDGRPLLSRTPGGTPVAAATGNRWVGPGHHSVVSDLAGQDWFVYHAIDRDDPYRLPPPNTDTIRPMLVDRLDWVGGWPVLRGGLGPSDEDVPAPVGSSPVADAFESGAVGPQWPAAQGWVLGSEPAGGYLEAPADGGELAARPVLRGDVRVRAAVRGDRAGLSLTGTGGDGVRAVVDGGELVLLTRSAPSQEWTRATAAALPPSFDPGTWHELELRRRGGAVVATVSAAGQGDAIATVRATSAAATPARVALVSSGGGAFDDVTAAPLYRPRTAVVPDPAPGPVDPAYGDEFDDGLGDGWTWLREPAAEVVDGQLRFTVQDADLTGASNDASVLLRDVPDGEWMAETAVTADFGRPDSYPQAGLIAYAGDDHYLRLAVRGHGEPLLTTFQKEMPYGTRTVANSATFGAGEPTTWLRLHHRRDPDTGAHLLRAASSPDGEHWTWSTTHTLPADAELRLGLAAHGGEPVEARFEYLRVHRDVN